MSINYFSSLFYYITLFFNLSLKGSCSQAFAIVEVGIVGVIGPSIAYFNGILHLVTPHSHLIFGCKQRLCIVVHTIFAGNSKATEVAITAMYFESFGNVVERYNQLIARLLYLVTAKDEVTVWCDKVQNPVKVRYAWADNPDDANLYNSEGLATTPFEAEIVK